MRSLSVLLCTTLAATALAQSPLATLAGGTNQGNVGGGLYFDITVNTTITFTQIDFRCGANTVAGTGTLDVYLGPTTYLNNVTNAALWTLVGSAPNVAVAPSTVSNGVLSTPFALGPGNYGIALKSNNHSHGYTNGVTCTSSTTPGACSNSLFSNTELTLRAGAAQNAFLTGGVFSPRIFNGAIHYTLGGTPVVVASHERYGAGCYGLYNSIMEFMPSTATGMDLGNAAGTNSLMFANIGTGYLVGPFNTSGTFFTPTAGATNLALTDESSVAVALPFTLPYPTETGLLTTTSIDVCSNGYISPGTPNAVSFNPTVAAFLAGEPRWSNWHDFDPGTGGTVTSEVDPSGNAIYITWTNVPDFGIAGSSNTFQIMLDNLGNVEFRWQAMSLLGGGGWPTLVGYTPGHAALDPGNTDLSALGSAVTGPSDNAPLDRTMDARPVLGTNPNVVITGYTPSTILGVDILSFTQFNPGIPLGILGAPGCFQFVNVDSTSVFFTSPVTTTKPFITGGIPNLPAFNGVLLFSQCATFTSGFNTLGVIFSNGTRALLGSL